MTLKWCLELLF